jgi:hypothetical protein
MGRALKTRQPMIFPWNRNRFHYISLSVEIWTRQRISIIAHSVLIMMRKIPRPAHYKANGGPLYGREALY